MEEQSFDLGEYYLILNRRKWAFVITALIIIGVAAVVSIALPNIYRSTATILIEEQEIPTDYVMTTVTGYAEQRIQSTQQRIMSTSKLLDIIEKYNLYEEYRDLWSTEEIVAKMRKDIELELISVETIDRRTGRPTAATIAFTISYQGKRPTTVQEVTGNLVSLFLNENLQARQRQTAETIKFLEQESQRVKEQLGTLEKQISAFKEEHIASLPEMVTMNMQSITSYETRVERMDDQIRMLRERESYLETQLASIPEMVNSEKNRIRELELALVDLKTRFTDDYPDVKKMELQIQELKKRKAEKETTSGTNLETPDNTAFITLSSQLSSTRAEIASLMDQREDLYKKTEEFRQRIENSPKIEREYNALVVDRNNTRLEYEDLLRKLMDSKVALGLERDQKGERFTLIDPARRPEKPYKPNRIAIFLLGLTLGIGAGIGVAALLEISDQTLYSPHAIKKLVDMPVLVHIPVIVTPLDIKTSRRKKLIWSASIISVIGISVLAFHSMVMDLDVFWAKLVRKISQL